MILTISFSVTGEQHVCFPCCTDTGSGGALAASGNGITRGAGFYAWHPGSPMQGMRFFSSSAVQSEAKVFIPVRMARYPVQRQMLPSKMSSISFFVALGLFTMNSDMFITKPTLQ